MLFRSGDFVRHVRDVLRELGYQVSINDPYKGAEILRRFSNPQAGRHSLQIEVNRRLYMDETTRARNGFFAKLCNDIETLNRAIADYAFNKAGNAAGGATDAD